MSARWDLAVFGPPAAAAFLLLAGGARAGPALYGGAPLAAYAAGVVLYSISGAL